MVEQTARTLLIAGVILILIQWLLITACWTINYNEELYSNCRSSNIKP